MDTYPTFNLCTKFGEICVHFKAPISLLGTHKVSECADRCVGTRLNLGRKYRDFSLGHSTYHLSSAGWGFPFLAAAAFYECTRSQAH